MTSYVFTHATVLDGTEGMEPQPNMTVVVNEGVIEKVGPAASTVGPLGAREIDLAGAYLAPGLVNLHVHLCGSGKPTSAGAAGDLIDKVVGNPLGRWYLRRTIRAHAQQQLASGVTTVRSVGDPGFADVDVRDAINAGKHPGPRLVTSGVGVTVPGGHGAGLFAHVASTPEEARAIVRDCFSHKCDLVKLFVTGGVFDAEVEGEPGVLRMSPEVAQAACDEARKLGLRTAAHIESAEGVRVGLEAGVDVRDAINAGKHPGPRLVTSGVGVTVPGGHGAGLFAHVASTPEEARAIVRDCFSHKCDLVKLFVTGGVFDAEVEGEPGVLRMSPEVAQAACDEARKLGLRTAAHIESAEGVRVGLEAGVDTIEHGAPLDDELIALFKRNGAGRASSLTCTVSPALPFVELDPAKTHSTEVQKVNGRIVFEGIVQAAKQALAAGIPVGLGTDSSCPYITQYDMWREVVYFERIVGASRQMALHTATLGNARILGLGDETGSVEAGKAADLIVLDRNPLENLEALRDVRMVMARGVLDEHPRVKRLAELDAELDGFLPGNQKH